MQRIALKYLRVILVVLLSVLYVSLQFIPLSFRMIPITPITFYMYVILIFTLFAYFSESNWGKGKRESFKDGNLFFKNGSLVNNVVLPIDSLHNFDEKRLSEFHGVFYEKMIGRITEVLKTEVNRISVFDQENPKDERDFIRLTFDVRSHASLSMFIYVKKVGNYLALNYLSYLKGSYKWFDVYAFIIFSPFTLLSWIFKWFKQNYSIRNALSKDIYNSFVGIDIWSYYYVANTALLNVIRDILEEEGLLSPELGNIINQYTYVNSNIISVDGNNNKFGEIRMNSEK